MNTAASMESLNVGYLHTICHVEGMVDINKLKKSV